MSVLLNEIFKLLHHAGAQNVEFFRLGTCGGIGLEPGTVVVTTEALNGELKPVFEQVRLNDKPYLEPSGCCQVGMHRK